MPQCLLIYTFLEKGDRRGCMVGGFTTTCAIGAYHHYCCEFQSTQ